MKIRLELLTDTIFGSGQSIPGGEDIGVLMDDFGFPYIKGSTLKGILREEWENYLYWTGHEQVEKEIAQIFGKSGRKMNDELGQLRISDFVIPRAVKAAVIQQITKIPLEELTFRQRDSYKWKVQEIYSSLRTFTSLENGVAKDNTLRVARCINGGLILGGQIDCREDREMQVEEVLSFVKFIGTMRTRGFGQVKMSKVSEDM